MKWDVSILNTTQYCQQCLSLRGKTKSRKLQVQTGKKEVTLSLFVDNLIQYFKNLKDCSKKKGLLDIINH